MTLANIFCWGVYRHRVQNSTTPGARSLSNAAVEVDSWTVCGLMSMVFGKAVRADYRHGYPNPLTLAAIK